MKKLLFWIIIVAFLTLVAYAFGFFYQFIFIAGFILAAFLLLLLVGVFYCLIPYKPTI